MIMVVYRGPIVSGYLEAADVLHNDIAANIKPELSGWLRMKFLQLRLDHFQLGVICLIGNCTLMAAYLAIQVEYIFILLPFNIESAVAMSNYLIE